MFLLSSKIPQFKRGGGGLEGSRNDVSFRGYQAKGNERQQGEGGGHKIGKMGRHRLWMAPNSERIFYARYSSAHLVNLRGCKIKLEPLRN